MPRRRPLPISTRPIPNAALIQWRTEFLADLVSVEVIAPTAAAPEGLAPGNKKTGQTGRLYKTVFVWNLPAVVTCPGKSTWCMARCYNADTRNDVFPLEEWQKNWGWILNQPESLRARILAQLSEADAPVAVRLHSSGDFFSNEYVRFWIALAANTPSVSYWAYTRSWVWKDLLDSLEEFRRLPNVQLFASWDTTMPPTPPGWRRSVVVEHPREISDQYPQAPHIVCPEQIGGAPNCASCGYCISDQRGHVTFILH